MIKKKIIDKVSIIGNGITHQSLDHYAWIARDNLGTTTWAKQKKNIFTYVKKIVFSALYTFDRNLV